MKKIFHSLFYLLLLTIILSAINTSYVSCRFQSNNEQLLQMDTLMRIVKETDDAFLIDEDAIGARFDSMQVRLQILHEALPDSGTLELKNNIVRYAGIMNTYKQFLIDYPVLSFDFEKVKAKAMALEKSVKSKDITESTFKGSYSQVYAQLDRIRKRLKAINYNVFAMEQDYRRTGEALHPIVERIKEKRKNL